MHVALVANTQWLEEQLPALHHLVVGLIEEQARVVQVLPEGFGDEEASAFAAHVSWRETSWSTTRRHRLVALEPQLRELGVTVLHALDGALWEGTARLARRLGAAVVFSASAASDVDRLPAVHRVLGLPTPEGLEGPGPTVPTAFLGASQPLVDALEQEVGGHAITEYVPVPVRAAQESGPQTPRQMLCVLVSGDGRLDGSYRTLFEALRAHATKRPRTQIFLDAPSRDQHDLWREARRQELLEHVSLVPRRIGHRELLMGADVLLHPQALGRCRSICLEAMAHGIPVIARADPWLDYLQDGTTAQVLNDPDADAWAEALEWVVTQPGDAAALGASARAWVAQQHVPATTVARTSHIYQRLTGAPLARLGF